jgi:amidase
MSQRLHAFRNDVLGDHDAVGVADRIQRGEISAAEACAAAIERSKSVAMLNAVQFDAFPSAVEKARQPRPGAFSGVPTFVKDNVDVAGMPTCHGSEAVPPHPAKRDGAFAAQYLSQGFIVLGKSRLPEFGFNATTEFMSGDRPTRNPWNTDYSSGASSGGAAALVASGVVPIAHANDGGGSIRIPAACCGLVGLKPTRGRFIEGEQARSLPVNIISEGVVTRSVRDTAHFFAGMERTWRNPKLPAIGLVEGPGSKRLRIGLVYDSINGHPIDAATRAAVENTAKLLERAGHRIEPMALTVKPSFAEDFALYWGMLAFSVSRMGKRLFHPEFDVARTDNLSRGLAQLFRSRMACTPPMLYRLWRSRHQYAEQFRTYDAVLTPVLAHAPPKLGYLSPNQSFESLFERLRRYVAFTPLNNTAGSPAISLPMGSSPEGLPIGVQLMAAHGAERTLLELSFELEGAQPFRRIQS